jgi:hypothetical protein
MACVWQSDVFLCEQEQGLEGPRFSFSSHVAGTNYNEPLDNSRSEKPRFEERPSRFTKNTSRQELEKQSGPWDAPPPDAGVLKASPPRNRAQTPEHPTPA